MVALGATWEGVTSPYFFLKGERLNGQLYLDQLSPFYKKEGDRLFGLGFAAVMGIVSIRFTNNEMNSS